MYFLVQLVDQTDPDFYANCGLPKAGDVVQIHDLADSWGAYFTGDPQWGVVFIDASAEDSALYMNPEHDRNPSVPSNTLQFRDRCIDVNALVDGMTYNRLAGITTMKPPIVDPNVIGG